MLNFRQLIAAFQALRIPRTQPVLVHASLSAFGPANSGAETVVGALMGAFDSLLAPTFTYKTMVIPQVGPENNAANYGKGSAQNCMAEFFTPNLPADPLMGIIPETIRLRPNASRSMHPILSFAGLNAGPILAAQSLLEPFAPVRELYQRQGWVLLLGVDHTVNTSIHYAERLARRCQFTRWALTEQGVLECPGFPGCSNGFQAVILHITGVTRQVQAGSAVIQALPVTALVDSVVGLIEHDAQALLCQRLGCERCAAVRAGSGRAT